MFQDDSRGLGGLLNLVDQGAKVGCAILESVEDIALVLNSEVATDALDYHIFLQLVPVHRQSALM